MNLSSSGRSRGRARYAIATAVAAAVVCTAPRAVAQAGSGAAQGALPETPPNAGGIGVIPGEGPQMPLPAAEVAPPPSIVAYLEYGVAFSAEYVANAGPMCNTGPGGAYDGTFCILGSGGGIVIPRIGWRYGPWYFGGAFELSKQDPNKLYRLALLKQLRAEARYYFFTARAVQPFLAAGAGVAGYGNELEVATWGPTAFLGAGVELQISNGPLFGLLAGYRPIYLQGFQDDSGQSRAPGVAHLLAVELTLVTQERLSEATTNPSNSIP